MAAQDRPTRDRLPRGSNALEPEELARRHRERLQDALVVRVAANGLFDTTIRDICTEAQVATRDLYALYPGKDELLLATCDAIVARASRQLDAARPQRGGRTGSLHDALAETLDALAVLIAAKPEAAHLVFIDVLGLGPRGLPFRRDLVTWIERVLFDAIAEAPGAESISEAAVQIVAGGTVHVAEHAVRTGQTRTLRTSAKHLASWAASYESAAPSPLPRPAIPAHGNGSSTARPLPRSTQRLPRQFVVAHQRDRILEATMSLAREEGYAGITIPAICAAAQISKRTFYEHFESKDEAFMAAFDVAFGRLYTRAWTAATEQASWPEAVRAGLRAWVAFVASEPELARFGFCDVLTGGRAAVAKVDESYRAFAYLLERGDDDRPEVVSQAIVGGIGAMVASWVADGRVRELPRLTPHLVYAALAPFVGDVEALQTSGLAPVGGPALPVPEPTDDRGRVLAAFADVVRERGYERAQLTDAAARAGVDAGIAQEYFEDEADCALQAIDGWSDRTFAAMSAAFAGAAGDGPLALHRALGAMLEQMASEPAMLHLAVGAVEHLGSRAVTRRTRYVSVFFDFLTPATAPSEVSPVEPQAVSEMIAGGIFEVLRTHVTENRIGELPAALPQISYLCAAPFFGAQKAARVSQLPLAPAAPAAP
ncbi:MAG TPA: TetR/AcrR family transcriptional regulator [Baekduia sp.]|nr:TetR/AcrR family transcriptional regulator [Baekduia sp.]